MHVGFYFHATFFLSFFVFFLSFCLIFFVLLFFFEVSTMRSQCVKRRERTDRSDPDVYFLYPSAAIAITTDRVWPLSNLSIVEVYPLPSQPHLGGVNLRLGPHSEVTVRLDVLRLKMVIYLVCFIFNS